MSQSFIKKSLGMFALCGVLVLGGSFLFAAPPDSPYLPGETLDPNCAPGDPNCSVTVTQDLSSRDTDDLKEGSGNLYYSEARVSNNSDVSANTLLRHNPVTLAGSNYLNLANQVITAGVIDISEHTNLSVGSGLLLTDDTLSASGLSTGNFTSPNISQWTNDSGYITSYTETDPVFTASAASGINSGNITNWNTAFGWGNHALEGYYGSGTKPFLKAISSTEENFGSTTAGGPGNATLTTPRRVWLESNQNTTLGLVGIRAETGHFDSQGSRTYRLRIYESTGAGNVGALLYEESFARSFPVGWDVREIDLPLTITSENDTVIRNIPLDPIGVDWNEVQKRKGSMFNFYSKYDVIFYTFTSILFYLGLAISIFAAFFFPSLTHTVILIIYALVTILRGITGSPKRLGRVFDTNGEPLAYGAVRVYLANTENQVKQVVTNQFGRFYCLVVPATYYVKVFKRVGAEDFQEIYTSLNFYAKDGLVDGEFGG
jgi:hypothetical protein